MITTVFIGYPIIGCLVMEAWGHTQAKVIHLTEGGTFLVSALFITYLDAAVTGMATFWIIKTVISNEIKRVKESRK
jgi:hypothetical protein